MEVKMATRVSLKADRYPRFRSTVERATNGAILVAALVCAAAWIRYGFMASAGSMPGSGVPQYSRGDSLATVPEITALESRPTLLLFLYSGCNVCTESLGFYRQAIDRARSRGARVKVVAASRESYEAFTNYLATNRVRPDRAIYIDDDSPFKLTRTPTILLLDENRRVKEVWLGRLVPASQAEVMRAIDAGS